MLSRLAQGEIVPLEQYPRQAYDRKDSPIRHWAGQSKVAKMKLQKIVTLSAAATLSIVLSHFAIAQQTDRFSSSSSGAQTGSQSGGDNSANPASAGQGGDDATLEIAPQPAARMPKPAVEEIPTNRNFRTHEDDTSGEPNYRPGTENDIDNHLGNQDNTGGREENFRPHRRPYLGITVQYATKCYAGGEEHGLEVINVDPNSPAAQAGLHQRADFTSVGAAASTLLGIVPGGALIANSALGRTGAMGQGGDLIVAIDDQRVRDQGDLQNAMARLKPGDTMYLTVIRPNGIDERAPHQTIKIAVKVGAVGEPIANAAPAGGFTQ